MWFAARLKFHEGFNAPAKGLIPSLPDRTKAVESDNQTATDRLLKAQPEGRFGFPNSVRVFPPSKFDDQLSSTMSEEHLMTDSAADYVVGSTTQGRHKSSHTG